MLLEDLPDDMLFTIINSGNCNCILLLMQTNNKFRTLVMNHLFCKNKLSLLNSIDFMENVKSTVNDQTMSATERYITLLHLTYNVCLNNDNSLQWKSNINILVNNLYYLLTNHLLYNCIVNNLNNLNITTVNNTYNKLINLKENILKITDNHPFTIYIFDKIFKNTYCKPKQIINGSQIYGGFI